jgi:NAD(P)-dependent dehydrogenase (short-subunit alcohol dehydrogenase family)
MTRLTNKVIVVTGGSGLLGRAYVDRLREEGAIVINADIDVKTDLAHHVHKLDITIEESVSALISNVSGAFGRIHGWVNNAYPRTSDWGMDFESAPFSSWRTNVDMHLNGYALCCREIARHMKQFAGGSIVNLASIYGMQGPDFTVYEGTTMGNPAAYSAIKGGIINFTKYLASYYGPAGIRANCISPGGIFDNQNELFVEKFTKKTPMRRMGLPKDIAPAIAFLLSDDASYITGHNLVIDGGWSIV